jgi:hypothetical protein
VGQAGAGNPDGRSHERHAIRRPDVYRASPDHRHRAWQRARPEPLHDTLTDVYWSDQGRKSVDAIFCVLVITGTLIGGADFVTGRVGTAAWWSSVAVMAVNLMLCVICLLKGKVVTGVIGVFISVVALVGAIRLAKPGSWWAARRYVSRPRLASRAASRYDEHREQRWNRLRDLVAGAPSQHRPG